MAGRLLSTLLLIAVTGCGFSNAMYNARRRVSDAERAAGRGDALAARTAYGEVIETAAVAFRKDPDGRHADEALLLVGRARFGLGEFAAARAAFARAAELAAASELRAAAYAWGGAAELELGRPAHAEALLDSALTLGTGSDALTARAHLWRARSRLELGAAGAREDLQRAAQAGGLVGREAQLHAARHAVAEGDSALAADALRALIGADDDPRTDAVAAVAHAAAVRWSPAYARALLDLEASAWPAAARDTLLVVHAELLALEGDTAAAVETALRAADRLGGPATDHARVLAARWQLQTATTTADLEGVRALLLPAVASAAAQTLLEQLRTLDALIDAAGAEGGGLALFAAGELARDALDAPGLARALFLDYAGRAPDAVWAPKAVLAAAALGGGDDALAASLAAASGNVYVQAVNGRADADAFAAAEAGLTLALTEIRQAAAVAAGSRDPTVGRAVAMIDSLRTRERADSMRAHCALLIDSLVIAGIRADSVTSACMRGDVARVDSVLRMDTLLLRDSADIDPRRRGRAVIDTLRAPRP
jgi:hypothetical protein